MIRNVLVVLILLLPVGRSVLAQSVRTLKIFQYEGINVDAKKLALTRVYNAQHKLVLERCDQRYYEDFGEGHQHVYSSGTTTHNTYQDTILVKSVEERLTQGDKTKTLYTHDQAGRRTGWQQWEYTRALKPGINKGLASPNGCIITENDLAAHRTWQLENAIRYLYDTQDRLVEYALLQDTVISDRRRFRFDAQGRLQERLSFCNNGDPEPCYRDIFSYDTLGALQKEVRYSYGKVYSIAEYHTEGSQRHEDGIYDDGSGTPTASYHHVKTLNALGRPTEEIYYQGNCELEITITTSYRSDGRVAQTSRLTCKDKRRVVHEYVYEDFN